MSTMNDYIVKFAFKDKTVRTIAPVKAKNAFDAIYEMIVTRIDERLHNSIEYCSAEIVRSK